MTDIDEEEDDEMILTEEVLEAFQEEAYELLQKWAESCLELEREPSVTECDNLFRILHTLKGSAQCVSLNKYGNLVHSIEEVVFLLRESKIEITSELVSFLLECQDRLVNWTDQIRDNPDHIPNIDDLYITLKNQYQAKVQENKKQAKTNLKKIQDSSSFDPNKPTILVVDDEVIMVNLIFASLQANFNVITANDGVEGIVAFKSDKELIKIIVTDVFMPNLDGISFVKTIRAESNIPIIVMSGLMKERLAEIKEYKNVFPLHKPIQTAQLLNMVDAILKQLTERKISF